MKINPQYHSYNNLLHSSKPQAFGAAKDITLKYVMENHERLLPLRIRRQAAIRVSKNIENITLRDLHLQTYSRLLGCQTLQKAQNIYPEFRGVLQANAVIKKGSKNTKAIAQVVPLEDLSLYILKERWGNLKTLDSLAEELGVKNRSALGWILDKIDMPDLGKNYQALLKASDAEQNELISLKVKAYNFFNKEKIAAHNRAIAQNPKNKERESSVAKEAWSRLPHIKAALKEFSKTSNPRDRFNDFWKKYPEYAKEFGDMKKIVNAERKAAKK